MNQDDFFQLGEDRPGRSLAGLEADVWAGVAAQARARRFATAAIAGQIAVLVVALGTSFTVGERARAPDHARPGLAQGWVAMSPASLLLGRRR